MNTDTVFSDVVKYLDKIYFRVIVKETGVSVSYKQNSLSVEFLWQS